MRAGSTGRASSRPVMRLRRRADIWIPRCFKVWRRAIMPLSVEEGICDGVEQVRRAVRYQIKYGAKVIKVCASGGVMSLTGSPGAQHFSDEELRAIVDEAHRRGIKVAAHAHGDQGIRAGVEAGIDCIEHGSLMTQGNDGVHDRTRDFPRGHELPRGRA